MTELHTATVPDEKIVKCAYCGKDGPWRTHSGVFECGACWDWRKLDSAAARYWYILSLMVASSIDMYDLTSFFPKKLGFSDEETKTFNRLIKQMFEKTEELAKEHHREDGWREQAQELYDQLVNGIRPKPEETTGGTDGP